MNIYHFDDSLISTLVPPTKKSKFSCIGSNQILVDRFTQSLPVESWILVLFSFLLNSVCLFIWLCVSFVLMPFLCNLSPFNCCFKDGSHTNILVNDKLTFLLLPTTLNGLQQMPHSAIHTHVHTLMVETADLHIRSDTTLSIQTYIHTLMEQPSGAIMG